MKVTESIARFLRARATPNSSDLVERALVEGMELQVNVAADSGTPVDGKRCTYTNGVDEWFSIRIPKNADSEPEFTDYDLRWPLDLHAEGIGCTGWLWKEKCSKYVAYDFDSIVGHSAGVGISDDDLNKVKEVVSALPYVEVRRSTGGKGIHLYVALDSIPTENHTVHAALARCVLGMMSSETNFDLASQIDACGSIMWVWHRKQAENGFALLKPATKVLTEADLPSNWRDHIAVVTRKRAKIKVEGVTDEDSFDTLAAKQQRIPLDTCHKTVIEELGRSGYSTIWISDRHMLQTHTCALQEVKESLGLKGVFRTSSQGRDKGSCNCFAFPLANGGWRVYRFSKGVAEDPTWTQDGEGWTNCVFNRHADLQTASRIVGAAWMGDACTCDTVEQARQLAKLLGVDLPPLTADRPVNVKQTTPQTIAFEAAEIKGEEVKGWGRAYRKLKVLRQVEAPINDADYDSTIVFTVTPEFEDAGWAVSTDKGQWVHVAKSTAVEVAIHRHKIPPHDHANFAGRVASKPIFLVNEPLQPEWLDGRRWNRHGARTIEPTYGGHHPHYDLILQHVGRGLNTAVSADPWCARHGIATGCDYIRLWCASIVQHPKQHLPLLYMYSSLRDNGKSAFHKSIALVFERGVVEGVRMLNEQFNRMLAGAVLVYLDEERVSKDAAERVKYYVDADYTSIRMMHTDAFMFPNYSHWIASYNFVDALPVEDGDQRVVMVEVPTLYDEDKIDWRGAMLPALDAERSDFLGSLLSVDLPPSGGRLYLPVLSTALKESVMAAGRTASTGCDRAELAARIAEKVGPLGRWSGRSADLLDLLGPGSWSSAPNHLRRYVREVADQLHAQGITVNLTQQRLITLETTPC